MKAKTKKSEVHNNTNYEIRDILKLPLLGVTINNWRQREIKLFQHPMKEDHVISYGVTFDASMTVIAEEPKSAWTTALQYAARGKIYESQ